jgi:hypothetical protein
MLNIIEKTFGRKILVDVLDTNTGRSPLGFDTHSPSISYTRLPYGKFGIRVKGSDPIDVVVRLDNKVLAQRSLEGGVEHTISRSDDGKPFYFAEPGTKPQHVAEDAGQPIDGSVVKQEMLFPELEVQDTRYAESQGLLIVQVRFSHVKPDFGPEYAPDDFANVLFQLNPPQLHAREFAKNASRIIKAESPAPEGEQRAHRQCCVACDRDGH